MATSDVHRFEARLTWAGTTAGGYDSYARAHEVRCPPVDRPLEMSAAPAFLGDPSRHDPEQLLLAAAASCQLLSFLAVAARARVDVRGYADRAEAHMAMADRPVRINRIHLRPEITVVAGPSEARLRGLVERAHRECFIANTLDCDVVVDPAIDFLPA